MILGLFGWRGARAKQAKPDVPRVNLFENPDAFCDQNTRSEQRLMPAASKKPAKDSVSGGNASGPIDARQWGEGPGELRIGRLNQRKIERTSHCPWKGET
jgi:hypothetical protein